MDELEQQIKAWADATAPVTGDSVDAADVIEGRIGSSNVVELVDAAPRRRERWLAVAAAVLVVAAVGIGLVVQSRDDGPEQVHASDPPAASTSVPLESGESTDVGFDELVTVSNGMDAVGLAEAQSEEELAALWADVGMNTKRIPEVDFDRRVVVAVTIADDACSPRLTAFQRTGSTIEPRFVDLQPREACEEPRILTTYVAALDWSDTGDEFLVVLAGWGPDDDQETLHVTRVTDPPVTATLELDSTELAAGSVYETELTVVNNSGKAIEGTTCGSYFVAVLRNAEVWQDVARPDCLRGFTIPEGTSTYPITLSANYSSCLGRGQRPGGDPYCEADGSMPPLPPGEYQLFIDDPQDLVRLPDPITITVT